MLAALNIFRTGLGGAALALTFSLVACSSDADTGGAKPANTSQPPSTSGPTVALSVVVDGTAAIRSEPAGIECPGTCSAEFAAGQRVKLISTPGEGWKMTAWSGACSGTGECEVVLEGPTEVRGAHALIDSRWDPASGAKDCADAWGAAGEKLSPCDKTPDDYVVVSKGKRNLAFCNSGKLVKNMRIGLGFTPAGDKTKQGDGKTPEGVFYIPRVLPDSDYYLAFLFSYPLKEDAVRAANEGLITRKEADDILAAHDACTEPSQDTNLGGAIEIHGMGSSADWTAGCVATENKDMDMLWEKMGVNDTIVVLP